MQGRPILTLALSLTLIVVVCCANVSSRAAGGSQGSTPQTLDEFEDSRPTSVDIIDDMEEDVLDALVKADEAGSLEEGTLLYGGREYLIKGKFLPNDSKKGLGPPVKETWKYCGTECTVYDSCIRNYPQWQSKLIETKLAVETTREYLAAYIDGSKIAADLATCEKLFKERELRLRDQVRIDEFELYNEKNEKPTREAGSPPKLEMENERVVIENSSGRKVDVQILEEINWDSQGINSYFGVDPKYSDVGTTIESSFITHNNYYKFLKYPVETLYSQQLILTKGLAEALAEYGLLNRLKEKKIELEAPFNPAESTYSLVENRGFNKALLSSEIREMSEGSVIGSVANMLLPLQRLIEQCQWKSKNGIGNSIAGIAEYYNMMFTLPISDVTGDQIPSAYFSLRVKNLRTKKESDIVNDENVNFGGVIAPLEFIRNVESNLAQYNARMVMYVLVTKKGLEKLSTVGDLVEGVVRVAHGVEAFDRVLNEMSVLNIDQLLLGGYSQLNEGLAVVANVLQKQFAETTTNPNCDDDNLSNVISLGDIFGDE